MDSSQRLHSLDNLRAVMMWLGIVLHVAVNHSAGWSPLPWRDRETTVVADLIMVFIHAFRMPVFFILAGLFVAMLVGRRGYAGMLKHRMRRIGLPFLLFWPPVFAATVVLTTLYMHLMVHGVLGFDPDIVPKNPARPVINTLHMWFIYYLLWFCGITALIGMLGKHLPDGFRNAVSSAVTLPASSWWGCVALALPLAAIGSGSEHGVVTAGGSFIPQPAELAHNGLFFFVGWHLYRHREALLGLYSRRCWTYAAAGAVFFIVSLGLAEAFANPPVKPLPVRFLLAFTYNCTTWFWSFALIGFFVRYLPKQNTFLRYVSDSSYWVYLVHMLGTIGFGVLLYDMPFNALTKMAINIVATTLACVGTYHFLVRYTFIGTLLNGKRAQKPLSGVKQKSSGSITSA